MNSQNEKNLLEQLSNNPPKIIGGYKRQGWAVKILENISNPAIEKEDDGIVTAKAVLRAADETFYPSFLTLDMEQKGLIVGAYLISEDQESYNLIPFELAKSFVKKDEKDLLPFKYRTLEKIDGDAFQKNWPDFS